VIHRWGAGMAQMEGAGVLYNFISEFRYWRKHRGFAAEAIVRAAVLLQAVAWIAGRTLLTLAGRKPRQEWGRRVRQYRAVAALALGFRRVRPV